MPSDPRPPEERLQMARPDPEVEVVLPGLDDVEKALIVQRDRLVESIKVNREKRDRARAAITADEEKLADVNRMLNARRPHRGKRAAGRSAS